ncbi:MAG: S1 RNA-binding domain-containing protein [Promethearchaeota archaeon]|nr:MAG: S1 RNA-binding domain-containing protein [Candidatus Lokiarchaeota archaeon]
MVKIKSPFPKEGDFVVGRAVNIEQQYIYVDLADYDGLPSEEHARGMIHVSEVSSRWIKNIRNYVRIGQIIVCRVLRVDPSKGHVDLSLRRVNSAQKKKVLKERKYAVKLENLLQFLTEAEGIKMNLDEAYEKVGWPILELFDYYQETIETLKENGEQVFENLPDVAENVKKAFLNIVDENVEITTVIISGKIKLKYTDGDGIEKIRETFTAIQKLIENPRETRKLEISYIGAPFYKIAIISKDYLDAESILSEAVEILESKTSKYNGSFELIRN